MKIAVPIKQVPETSTVKMDPETGTMVREGVEAIVNPLDLYAIETAIRLRQEHGGEATCITMGPPAAQKALREAISMGMDAGVLVSDKKFAGSDTWATSLVLANVLKSLGGFDMIICGERATDGDTGQVGPETAAFLDLPVATYIGSIDAIRDGTCRCRRMVEDGYEILEVQLPAVLTVVKEIGIPRLPTLRGKQKARHADIRVITAKDLGIPEKSLGLEGSPTKVMKISSPAVSRKCRMLTAKNDRDIQEAIGQTVDFLREKKLI